jgi:hypothetical protein
VRGTGDLSGDPPGDLSGDPPGVAGATVDAWLGRVAAALPGPRRARAAIVDELRDGLHEAIGARRARGAPAPAAARDAVAEFGDPATVAAAFAGELSAAGARALGLRLVGSGPLVGALWLGALLTGPTGLPIPPWHGRPAGPLAAWPLVLAAVATVVAATALIVATTGRLSRWLPVPPRLPAAAAATAGLVTAAVDLTVLATLAAWALGPSPALGPLLPLAVAASLTRMTLAARAARACLAAPAA